MWGRRIETSEATYYCRKNIVKWFNNPVSTCEFRPKLTQKSLNFNLKQHQFMLLVFLIMEEMFRHLILGAFFVFLINGNGRMAWCSFSQARFQELEKSLSKLAHLLWVGAPYFVTENCASNVQIEAVSIESHRSFLLLFHWKSNKMLNFCYSENCAKECMLCLKIL